MKVLSELLRSTIAPSIAIILLGATPVSLTAQPKSTAHVVMLSDIHFDPFHDPGKIGALRRTSISHWAKILDAPPSTTQQADFEHLQSVCSAEGVDTPYVLLHSTLEAMHKRQPTPAFLTVSGALLAHQFDCRFHTLFPSATPEEYSAFAAKTVEFVAWSLWDTYPTTPVYLALGDTDSGCPTGREDPGSDFLQTVRLGFAANTHTTANRYAILFNFGRYGDYSVLLPHMQKTRLIVMQDVYQGKNYRTCNGQSSPAGQADPIYNQTFWLHEQLKAARQSHEKVWIMAHLPPGVDTQTMVARSVDVCTQQVDGSTAAPTTFLSTEFLANSLDEFSDIIQLTLFGHTQMDELRLFKTAKGTTIPGKILPAISPTDGNSPAFLVATVDTHSAVLQDYRVIAATGDIPTLLTKPTPWADEYTFSAIYHLPDLSGASLDKLATSFVDDDAGINDASQQYQHFFFASDPLAAANPKAQAHAATMKRAWATYACSITQARSAGFRSCVCPAKPSLATTTSEKPPLQPQVAKPQ